MMTALFGCQEKNESASVSKQTDSDNKLSIVATIFPQYDFTRQIIGERADLTMLLTPGSETHSYDPSPQDIIKIQNCDVFIYTGGESDEWVNDILTSMDTSSMNIISLMDLVETVEEELKEGMEEEGEEEAPEYDEHVWTSPQNAIRIVQSISDTLCKIDEANVDTYTSNTESYINDLKVLDIELKELTTNANRNTLVFGDRFPLRYFVEEYDLEYWAAFPGCSTETEPSASTVAFLVDKVREENIPIVFQIELSSGNIARSIAESASAEVKTFYSCHNVTRDDFEGGATYLSLMRKNVETLKEALY